MAIRQKENGFRDKFERHIARDRRDADLRRKALSAVAAKMARVVHAVVKSGQDYRPFIEAAVPSGRTPFRHGPCGRARDPVDKARVFRSDRHLVLRTVRATALAAGPCVRYG